MTEQAYIAGYVRTPFTFAHKGSLAGVMENMSRVPMWGFNLLPPLGWNDAAAQRTLATQRIGGGMGIAMVLEAA